MATLGTRKFYKPFQDSQNEEENQILNKSGYVTIKLHSAYYNSKGNFWQSIFEGNDKIALFAQSKAVSKTLYLNYGCFLNL